MTRLTNLGLCAVLALATALAPVLAPAPASAQGFTLRLPDADPAPRGLAAQPQRGNPTAATAEDWSRRGDIICGGDSLIVYDPDENGDPINGTVRTSCLDD